MAELMDLMDRFMEEVFDWRVFCGIVAAIIVFIIEIRLTRNHKPANRRAEKARKMGHVIKAKRVKAWDEDTTGYSVDSWFHGTYGYQVDGKSYEYRYMSKVYPPYEMTLYYINDPGKAFVNEVKKKEHSIALISLLLPIGVFVLTVFLLGAV